MVLLAIWAAGVVAVVGRLAVGLVAVAWLSRRTVRVVDAPWLALAVELASELGITRRLRFLESARASMPMAAGIFTPSVLMPEDANRWPLERLRIVLLHELAHVKRRDCLTHVIAQLACALHWFNPLAWIAARHIRTERERACDDLVLACGTRGSDYAEELLEIARVMRGGRYPALLAGATLAMAHRSQLEGRLIAILDPKVPRSGVSPVRAALAVATVACALPVLAAMQPWAVATVEATAVPVSSRRFRWRETPRPRPDLRSRVDAHAHAPASSDAVCRMPRPEIDSAIGPEIAQADRRRDRARGRRAGAGCGSGCRAGRVAGRGRSQTSRRRGRASLRASSRALFTERSRARAPSASHAGWEARRRPIPGWSRR